LNNFPVLISITDDSNLKASAQDDGGDIVFTDLDNNIKYDHEIEKFDKATGELVAWVKLDSLPSTGTNIWMWYGNPNCADQWNVEGTWDSNYKMVQHLQETSGTRYDSTANGNTGQGYDVNGAIGQVDGANAFTASGCVDCGSGGSLDVTGEITIEAWAKPNSFGYWSEIVSKRAGEPLQSANYDLRFGNPENPPPYNKIEFYWRNGNWQIYTTSSTYTPGAWYYIVATREGYNPPKIYVGGVQVEGTCTVGSCTNDMLEDENALNIGAGIDNDGDYNWGFNGIIDEVRISSTARSAGWIETSYNNQKDPGSFLSVGEEEGSGGQDPVPELPTIILFSVGLLMLAGYIVLRRRKG